MTKNKVHMFAGVEKLLRETFLPHLFFWKTEITPTHCMKINYDAGQEIWPRPTIPGDISQI